jgi:hypothetical protein
MKHLFIHNRKQLIVILSFSLILAGCIKDYFDFNKLAQTEWNPNLAIPLVHSTITIQDILYKSDQDGNIQVDGDKFCTLVYKDRLFSLQAKEFISVPDQSYNNNLSLSATDIVNLTTNNTVTVNYTQTITFSSGQTLIDSMIYKSGIFNVFHNSDFAHGGTLTITMPTALKNGVPFQQTINLSANGSGNINYSLAGYSFDMTEGGTTNNQFKILYQLTLNNSGNPTTTTQNVAVTTSFYQNDFDRIYGYIDQVQLSPYEDTVLVKLFNNSFGNGTFRLVNPYLNIAFNNSFGVPIYASFNKLQGYNPVSNTIYDILANTTVPSPLPIYSPTLSQIGQSITGTMSLSGNYMVDMINEQPKYVIYELNSMSNPAGPPANNFVIDTSRFTVDMELYLPLHGRAMDFVFQDTLNFTFDKIEEIDNMLLRTYISNGFPIEVYVQVYFANVDSSTSIPTVSYLDSLIVPYQILMPSAAVNLSTGRVTMPSEKTTDCIMDKAKIDRIKTANKLFIRAKAATTNNGANDIKIYSDYTLQVKIGVQTQVKTKF